MSLATYFAGGFVVAAVPAALHASGIVINIVLAVWFAASFVVSRIVPKRIIERRRLRKLEHEFMERSRLYAEEEARELTIEALNLIKSSRTLPARMPALLDEARSWLRQAEDEFNENAFGPFWEALEQSVVRLAEFEWNVNTLVRYADRYRAILTGREHTFPAFPVDLGRLPDPMPVAEEVRSVLRRGQTNFQFAMIWEQYKTRRTIAHGFQTLEEAINQAPASLIRSWNVLTSTLSG